MKLWVVGKNVSHLPGFGARAWSLDGIYDDKVHAVSACITEHHWIGPMDLNQNVAEDIEWPGGWYPMLQDDPEEGL